MVAHEDVVTAPALFDESRQPTTAPDTLVDPVYAYIDGLSPASQEAVWKRLRTVARLFEIPDPATFPWHHLRAAQVARIRQRLMQPYGPTNKRAAPATVNLTLAVFRGIAREARNANAMSDEEYRRVCEVKADKGERLPRGRAVPTGELTALVRACAGDASLAGARDAAMLAALYTGGLRRSELAALALDDYTAAPPTLRVLHGKNDKQRAIPIPASAAAALNRWLELRGAAPGALFVPIDQAGRIVGDGAGMQGMSAHAIYKMLNKRARQAGIPPLTPHDMRRTFVGDLLTAGNDISAVQRMAGHASVTTTQRYDRRGEEVMRRAADTLHFPTMTTEPAKRS
jgi:integrase